MKLKFVIAEDFINYYKPSLFVGFPCCSFKCEKECGIKCCQNSDLVKKPTITVNISTIIDLYTKNEITKAIVFGGLEPLDTWEDVIELISEFRKVTNDDIVIYTGYREDEIQDKIQILAKYPNILVKFGRFRPNQKPHVDEILKVSLMNDEQYCKKIS